MSPGGICGQDAAASPAAAGLPSLAFGLALALFAGMIWAVDGVLSSPALAAASGLTTAVPALAPAAAQAPADVPAAVATAGNPVTLPGPAMSPRLAACCEIVMGMTMSYMLITML
jgi:hypothetical protein